MKVRLDEVAWAGFFLGACSVTLAIAMMILNVACSPAESVASVTQQPPVVREDVTFWIATRYVKWPVQVMHGYTTVNTGTPPFRTTALAGDTLHAKYTVINLANYGYNYPACSCVVSATPHGEDCDMWFVVPQVTGDTVIVP